MLRVAKRRASNEDAFDDFVEAEFTLAGSPDLSLSVYDVGDSDIVRMHAEHAAGCGLDQIGRAHV